MVPVASSSSSTTTCWSTCSPTLVSPQPQTHVKLGREPKRAWTHPQWLQCMWTSVWSSHTKTICEIVSYFWLEMFKSPQRTLQHLSYVVGLLQIWFWGCRRQIFLVYRTNVEALLTQPLVYIYRTKPTNLISTWNFLRLFFVSNMLPVLQWLHIIYFIYFSRCRFI